LTRVTDFVEDQKLPKTAMSLPPRIPTLLQTGLIAFLGVSPGWCADIQDSGSHGAIPEPATSLLGLLGLCLILLRRGKP
jgi:hypothetical protein